ncbi:hypothetical protein [Elizabethkingia anophelis]|uniref:hypothetical protein n=1 Tax=Elizabethkingia anophelis TaxID=1117645 RepID=UPI000A98EF59|nr:hypothetical protein [Elizabethkingia anophelis]MCT3744640.1 hypothetical protein [Elizabethkingia anophelis]MDC8026483.1 hypothetical protein [Elizabethkingia anophelis]
MKRKIILTLLMLLTYNLGYSQEFGNFYNVEKLFDTTKSQTENKIINEYGYQRQSIDKKSGLITYTKKNSIYTFTVNLLFKGDKLKMIGWNDVVGRGRFIVNDIGNDQTYKIDESKTNNYLGVFTSISYEKGFQATINRTQQNLNKGMVSFTLVKTNTPTNNIKKENSTTYTSLKFLKKYNGKYTYEVKLFNNPILKNRLVKLMGIDKYTFMKNTWRVEGGISVKNNILTTEGCEQHNCDSTNFIVVIDLERDILYVGYKVENDIYKFGEEQNYPLLILNWEKENIQHK